MATACPLRTTAPAALPAAALAAVHWAPVVSTFEPLRDRTMPRLSGRAHADHVALPFDAGPDPLSTPFFPRLLDERGVRATFFLLGSVARRSPAWCAGSPRRATRSASTAGSTGSCCCAARAPYDHAGHTRVGPPHGDRGPRRRRHYPAARLGPHLGPRRLALGALPRILDTCTQRD
ncbi:hypothetical protein O1M63_49925 [Streptomyces mirabilis]|nr:hypothetical protein [Streptomyces mirabilis]